MAILTIKKMPLVAPRGIHTARFVGVNIMKQTDAGEACNLLSVKVELMDTKDGAGKAFRVDKVYNLDGRGATAFAEDHQAWSGVALTPEALNEFDDAWVLDKSLKVEVDHRKDGKELVPVIKNWLPATTVNS